MTVMLRAANVVRSQMHAVLSPTTRGIRAALDADGETRSMTLVIICSSHLTRNSSWQ